METMEFLPPVILYNILLFLAIVARLSVLINTILNWNHYMFSFFFMFTMYYLMIQKFN